MAVRLLFRRLMSFSSETSQLEKEIRRQCMNGQISEAMKTFGLLTAGDRTPSQDILGALLHGFQITQDFKQVDEVFAVVEKITNPGDTLLSSQINCLATMGHFQEAWQVYQRMLQNGIAPRRGVILLLLNKAIEDHDLPRVLELLAVLKDKHHSISPDKSQKILQKAAQEGEKWRSVVWEVMEIYRNCLEPLTQEVSDEIINWLKRDWEQCCVKQATVIEGHCSECGHQLETNRLDEKEHSVLLQHSRDQLEVEANSFEDYEYEKREVDNFISLLKKYGPFGSVIDGLNVSMISQGTRNIRKLVYLSYWMKNYTRQYLPVLIIARKHLAKRFSLGKLKPNPSILDIQTHYADKGIFYYFITNRNADDSYFVHGTLASGPSTLFVSNDLLGDYVERLPSSHLRRIFHKWQRSCQVHLMKDNSTSLIEDRIKLPVGYDVIIQRNETSVHIPLETGEWICATNHPSKQKSK